MLKVAIVQAAPVFINLEASLARAIKFIGQAAAKGSAPIFSI
jgi:predicted amidohydrolase